MHTADENRENHTLKSAAEGDKSAYGILYTHYLDEIYRFVYFKIGHARTAEDITEETFIRTWEVLPRIYTRDGKIDNLRAWLYRTANNLVIDFYRKSKPIEPLDPQEPGQAVSPESAVIAHEQSETLAKAIRKLSPQHQQIILLRLVNELSHQEAAGIMNISEGHSRVILYRAIKALKKILAEDGGRNA